MEHEDNRKVDPLRPAGRTNSERQAAFKKRQRAEGKRMVTIWIDESTRQAGFEQGIAGRPGLPIDKGVDAFSWIFGWIDGDAQRHR